MGVCVLKRCCSVLVKRAHTLEAGGVKLSVLHLLIVILGRLFNLSSLHIPYLLNGFKG